MAFTWEKQKRGSSVDFCSLDSIQTKGNIRFRYKVPKSGDVCSSLSPLFPPPSPLQDYTLIRIVSILLITVISRPRISAFIHQLFRYPSTRLSNGPISTKDRTRYEATFRYPFSNLSFSPLVRIVE